MTRTRNTNFKQNHGGNKEFLIPSSLLSFPLPLQHLCLSIAQDLYVLLFSFRRMCCQEGISGSFRHTPCLLFYGKSIWRLLPICLLWGPASHGKAPVVVVFLSTWPWARFITLSDALVHHRKLLHLRWASFQQGARVTDQCQQIINILWTKLLHSETHKK